MNNNQVVDYGPVGSTTDTSFSKAIWQDCPIIHGNLNDKVRVAELDPANLLTSTLAGDTSPVSRFQNQSVRLAVTAAANADSVIGGKGDIFAITDGAGSTTAKPLWFEMVATMGTVTDLAIAFGLTTTAGVAINAITDTTTVVASGIPFVGFNTLVGAPTALQTWYKDASQAGVAIDATFGVLASATLFKAGFKYDPAAPAAKRIKFYFNGVEGTDAYVTATIIADAAGGTNDFPQDLGLTWMASIKTVTGAANNLDIHRLRVAQLI